MEQRAHIQGQALYVRSARLTARTMKVRAVLHPFVPNKGMHPFDCAYPCALVISNWFENYKRKRPDAVGIRSFVDIPRYARFDILF